MECAAAAKSLQSCPTLCDPIDGSLPGSAIPGILQARTLQWVAISFSKMECGQPLKAGKGKKTNLSDFSGSPVAKPPRAHCRGHGFPPSPEPRSCMPCGAAKKTKR